MEPAFYLSTWGRRERGVSVRLMRRLCRHVRISIVIIGLARLSPPFPLRDGRMYIGIGLSKVVPGLGRASKQLHQNRRKRDEGESWLARLAGGCALSCVVSEVVSVPPSSTLETGAMKGKKRVSAQNRPRRNIQYEEGGGYRSTAYKYWLERAGALLPFPCTPSCHIWHATQPVP
jgi:hypothetical protein